MEIKAVQEFIKGISDKDLNTPVLIIGATGIGKSYQLKDLAKEQGEGFGFIDLRLATQEVTDLIGIPRMVKDSEGHPRTTWTKPTWFPKAGTKGILALEELNRAPEDVRQAIFQLLTEWKLHTHELPSSWAIVGLINPDNGSYHVNQLDPAFRRRFVQIAVDNPTDIDWCKWAKNNEVESDVIRFVATFPRLLANPESIEIQANPTPAGYHLISKLLKHKVLTDDTTHEILSGIVGVEAATSFISSLKKGFEKPITADQILENYSKVQDKFKQQVANNRNDMTYVTMVDLIATFETLTLTKSKGENIKNFLLDCPSEMLTTIVLRSNLRILNKLSQYEELITEITKITNAIR